MCVLRLWGEPRYARAKWLALAQALSPPKANTNARSTILHHAHKNTTRRREGALAEKFLLVPVPAA